MELQSFEHQQNKLSWRFEIMRIKELSKILPSPIRQKLKHFYYGAAPLQFRYGKIFRESYNFLCKSQWWSKKELEEYQMDELAKLLHHAYENVPYYKRVFNERGIKPRDIQNFDDLKRLPYLTKDEVRNNLEDLIAKNIPKENMAYVTTGGTSGKPLGIYIEKKNNRIRSAFDWRHWNWMGYQFYDKCVVLRGNLINKKGNNEPAWWEYYVEKNYLILSSYDMTNENLPKYVEKIEEYNPIIMRGYPSTLEVLAKCIKENNLKINTKGNIKAIATSSENFYQGQRRLIEDVFKCPIFDLYGNSEQTVRLGECEKHEGYHVFLENSYVEIINKEGKKVTREGEIGEIVGTGFTNYAVPLINYKTEDFAIFTNRTCSCGRKGLPLVKEIKGRWFQERIITKNGNYILITAMNSHSDIFDNVKQFQYYQDDVKKVILRIVKKDTYSDADTRKILNELQSKLKNQIKLEIQFFPEIPRTDRGKHKFLIQKLPMERGYGEETFSWKNENT